MAQFHFVEDYERFVQELVGQYPLDEAMSRAVGGGYEAIGNIEADIVEYAGLSTGETLIDLGCGSGRLAVALSRRANVGYIGIDVVQSLLNYAESKCPENYEFILNHKLTLPLATASADVFCAFSVFTHLLHHETYLYLKDAVRCLRKGGKIVFSFFEMCYAPHYGLLVSTAQAQIDSALPHLNMFLERNQIMAMASDLGLGDAEFVDGQQASWQSGAPLGQSVCLLKKV